MFQKMRMRKSTSDQPESSDLYDVTERFNCALSRARKERGEPDEGIARTVYDAKLWAKTHPKKSAQAGIVLVGLGAGLIAYLVRKQRKKIEETSNRWQAA
jgi:hypothetical protein